MTKTGIAQHLSRYLIAATLVVGLGTLGVWITTAGAATPSGPNATTISLTGVPFRSVTILANADKTGSGSEFIGTDHLFNGKKLVGKVDFVFVQTTDPSSNLATGNAVVTLFGQGQLTFQGLSNFAKNDNVAAITGGTDHFFGARGEATFVSIGTTPNYTATYHIVTNG